MSDIAWTLYLVLVPLIGAVLVATLPTNDHELAKRVALGVTIVEFAVFVMTWAAYDKGANGYQFVTSYKWIPQFGIHFSIGLNGISLPLVGLSTLLTAVVVLASWHEAEGGTRSVKAYFALTLVLEAFMVCVFSATDVFLFYVIFEAMLIPAYFLIGSYGGAQRSYAAVKFLLYSLAGGLLMLASVIGIYVLSAQQLKGGGTFDLETLKTLHITPGVGKLLFLGFFVAFAIKAPLVPFHTWLPDAGAEAPTGTAVLLVGVLDKVGTFGFLVYCIPLFPDASRTFTPLVITLGVIGVLYGALVAMVQRDLKRLVSYTSVAHFGFIAIGVFAFTTQAQSGAVLYMVNHGLSTGALFLVVGFLWERRKSRDIEAFGGVGSVAPLLGGAFLVAGLSSLALPGMNSFVSEFLVLAGTFTRYKVAAIIATTGIVLAALYILIAYQRVVQGPVVHEEVKSLPDLTPREIWVMAPLVALIVGLGVYPKPLLDVINPAVRTTLDQVHRTDPAPTRPVAATTTGDGK